MEIERVGQELSEAQGEATQDHSVRYWGRDWKVCRNEPYFHLTLDCFANCIAEGGWHRDQDGGWYQEPDSNFQKDCEAFIQGLHSREDYMQEVREVEERANHSE